MLENSLEPGDVKARLSGLGGQGRDWRPPTQARVTCQVCMVAISDLLQVKDKYWSSAAGVNTSEPSQLFFCVYTALSETSPTVLQVCSSGWIVGCYLIETQGISYTLVVRTQPSPLGAFMVSWAWLAILANDLSLTMYASLWAFSVI